MIIYTKTGCPWCVDAITYLKSKGYSYEERDVRTNAEWFAEMQELSGQTYAPTLVTKEGKLLADFDTQELTNFLKTENITS